MGKFVASVFNNQIVIGIVVLILFYYIQLFLPAPDSVYGFIVNHLKAIMIICVIGLLICSYIFIPLNKFYILTVVFLFSIGIYVMVKFN